MAAATRSKMTTATYLLVAFVSAFVLASFVESSRTTRGRNADKPQRNDRDPPVRLTVKGSNSFVLPGIVNDLFVAFDVTTEERREDAKRNPMNLAIVLDKSGSMSWEYRLETCKKALLTMLPLLHPEDRVHLVTYDSDVSTVFENMNAGEHQTRMQEHVRSIQTNSATNLWGGMEQGMNLIKKYAEVGRENRVMLFSDGNLNQGLTDTETILAHINAFVETPSLDPKIYTFGIGSDYNEKLMRQIAKTGAGEYFFIEESQDIEKFVETSFLAISEPSVYDAVLKVVGLNGGVVQELAGSSDIKEGVRLGDLRPFNTRTVMGRVSLAVEGRRKSSAGGDDEHEKSSSSSSSPFPIIEYELSFRVAGEDERRVVKGEFIVSESTDQALIAENEDKEVIAKSIIEQTSKLDIQVQELLEKGEVEKAKEVHRETIDQLKKADKYDMGGLTNSVVLLEDALQTAEKLETGGASMANQKRIRHRSYLKQHADSSYSQSYNL